MEKKSLIQQKIDFKYAPVKPFVFVKMKTLPGLLALPIEEIKLKTKCEWTREYMEKHPGAFTLTLNRTDS